MRLGLWALPLWVCAGSCDAPSAIRQAGMRPTPRPQQSLVVGRPADALSLDPALVSDTESVEVTLQLFERLVSFDAATSSLKPSLASSWTISPDQKVWTFHLRSGVRFHDGTPVDADAVVFSLMRQIDPKHPYHKIGNEPLPFAYAGSLFRYIVEVSAIDRLTVRIALSEPYAPFAANIAMFPASIVSKTAVMRYGQQFARHPVGTGPFRMVEWKNHRIVLERNPDYWGNAPWIQQLVFREIGDGRQRLTALESGAIDLAYSIAPDELQFVSLHPDLALHKTRANNVAYMAMNTQHAPLDDVRVRRAINHAINKLPIVKLAYQGLAEPAWGPLPPTQWGANPDLARYEYDQVAARKLLLEALRNKPWDTTRVLKLYVPSIPRPYLPDPDMVARVIAANLQAVGIRVDIVMQPLSKHLASVEKGEHDLCILGWVGDNGDPDNYLYVLLSGDNSETGHTRNFAFFRHPAVTEILAAAQREQDREARRKLYFQAQEIIAKEAPWVPLAHSQIGIAARADILHISLGEYSQIDFSLVSRDVD